MVLFWTKIDVAHPSEKSVSTYQTILRYIPADSNHEHHRAVHSQFIILNIEVLCFRNVWIRFKLRDDRCVK